jgi:hypothetical protein
VMTAVTVFVQSTFQNPVDGIEVGSPHRRHFGTNLRAVDGNDHTILYSIHPIAHVMTSQSLNCVLAHVSGSFLCLSLTLISKANQFFVSCGGYNAHRHSSDAVCSITLHDCMSN